MSALYRILAQLAERRAEGVAGRIDTLYALGRLTDEEYRALVDKLGAGATE